jgi:hypothetical protein
MSRLAIAPQGVSTAEKTKPEGEEKGEKMTDYQFRLLRKLATVQRLHGEILETLLLAAAHSLGENVSANDARQSVKRARAALLVREKFDSLD